MRRTTAAAKAAIISLTKSAAAEAAHLGIRVNAVCPGYVDTPLLAPFDDTTQGAVHDADRHGPHGQRRGDRRARAVPCRRRVSYCTGDVFTAVGRLRLMPTIFTRIIDGEIPGTFVWRDDRCVVFMSINPIARGHALVVPIEELDHWIELEPIAWRST